MIAELRGVLSDVRYLAAEASLQRWLTSADPADRQVLARNYRVFAANRMVYDQVRFIGTDGREAIRANWSDAAPEIVADSGLQDKSGRDYVEATLALGAREVHISNLDLNRENGRIETPLKPTIRFGTPVFDGTGSLRGIVVVNYLARRLLEQLSNLAQSGGWDVWLLNREGYWMLGPSPADEWGFMFSEREERSFANAFPQAWRQIQDGRAIDLPAANGDRLISATVFEDPAAPGAPQPPAPGAEASRWPLWYIVARQPEAVQTARSDALIRQLLAPWLSILALLAAISLGVAIVRSRQQHADRQRRASDSRFRALVESAPDAVVVTDTEGNIQLVNGQTEAQFGYARDSLLGRPVELLLPERFRSRHGRHRNNYIKKPLLRPMGADLPLYGLRRDGSEFPVSISLSPVTTEQGTMVFCDIRDISDRKAAEEKIIELNARLRHDNAELAAVNGELESFSYSVSHDLRAPLRAIDGFSQALLEDCADSLNAQGRDHLERVRRAAQRMGMLIDDLISLSRVARTPMALENVDLRAMAEEIVEDLRSGDPDRSVEVDIQDGLQARADPRLLRIALENLLANAWKYTSRRAEAKIEFGRAEGRSNGQESGPAFFVRDNGAGFDMAHADRLFGAFQRLHPARDYPGSGIGLATVQRIVHKHGGEIWAEAKPDQGASFYFTI